MEGESGTRSRAALRRREFLIGGAGAGIALAGPLNYAAIARNCACPPPRGGKFAHGVAAGFPSPKGGHALDPGLRAHRSSKLTLEVAKDKDFRNVVESKEVVAEDNRDFTVHQHVGGLDPGTSTSIASPPKQRARGSARSARCRRRTRRRRSGSASTPARTTRPATSTPRPRWRRRTSTSSSASATTSTSTATTPGRRTRLDTTGANGDGDVQTLDEYRRSTASTRRTRTCRRCTPPTRSSRSGTTTRSRTTTPATSPTRRRRTRTSRTTTTTRAGCRSASGARTATRPSSRRCRGSR